MNSKEMVESVRQTFLAGLAILEKKNADYATVSDPFRNFNYAKVLGVSPEKAILVRVVDKIARIDNLLEKEVSVTDEGIEDTLVDAINYLAILKAKIEARAPRVTSTVLPSTSWTYAPAFVPYTTIIDGVPT